MALIAYVMRFAPPPVHCGQVYYDLPLFAFYLGLVVPTLGRALVAAPSPAIARALLVIALLAYVSPDPLRTLAALETRPDTGRRSRPRSVHHEDRRPAVDHVVVRGPTGAILMKRNKEIGPALRRIELPDQEVVERQHEIADAGNLLKIAGRDWRHAG
jgi:hypothetical protein